MPHTPPPPSRQGGTAATAPAVPRHAPLVPTVATARIHRAPPRPPQVPAAVSHMPRCMSHVHPHGSYGDGVCGCLKVHEDALEVMGTSVRTRWWRYVVWANWSAHARRPALLPKAAQHEGRVELYAFQGNEYLKDSAMLDMEKRSIASKPENRGVMQHLHELALDSWGMGPGAENEL